MDKSFVLSDRPAGFLDFWRWKCIWRIGLTSCNKLPINVLVANQKLKNILRSCETNICVYKWHRLGVSKISKRN